MKKILKKILIASVAAGSLIFTPQIYNAGSISVVHAEIKNYTGVGKGTQSELVTAAQAQNEAIRAESGEADSQVLESKKTR